MDVDAAGPNLMRIQKYTRDLFDSVSKTVWTVRIRVPESESDKGESDKAESGKAESGKGESDKGESGKGESGKGESGKGESGKGESDKGESDKGESGKGESGKGESGKGESDKGDEGDDNDVVRLEDCYTDDLTLDDYFAFDDDDVYVTCCDNDDYVACCDNDPFDDKEEEVNGKKNKMGGVISLTAFAVGHTSNCAYLLTCAHGSDGADGWYKKGVVIRARPLEGPRGTYEALVLGYDTSYDSCLLMVSAKLKEEQVAKWGDGRVEIGETIYLVGNPLGMLGTGDIGNACYPCENLDFHPGPDDKVKCKHYFSSSWQKPPHRVMGNLFNAESLYGMDAEERQSAAYELNLPALLPIIQCSGFAAGSGASGSPIFNQKKEFIGMHVCSFGKYSIGIHVSALDEFVAVSLKNFSAKKKTRLEKTRLEKKGKKKTRLEKKGKKKTRLEEKIEEQQQGIEKQPFKKGKKKTRLEEKIEEQQQGIEKQPFKKRRN